MTRLVRAWLPRSLFGRLMLILAGGLLLAQLLSAAINLAERDRLLLTAGGMQQAQRIGDAVKLLDTLGPAERQRVAAVLSVPPLVLSVQEQRADWRDQNSASPRALMFGAMLRAAMGDSRAMDVGSDRVEAPADAVSGAAGRGPWRGMMGGAAGMERMHAMGPGGPALRAQVQLRDGSWARFDTQLPPVAQGFPWRLAATLGVLLAAILLLSFVAVRWVTRPLHVLAHAAEELGRDIHRPPLPEEGPLEIRQAARAFNTMQVRLTRFIEDRTRMLAAMSHDLKTPITRMRLRADLMEDDELRQHFEADLKEMETMVTHTLEFMRGLGGNEPTQPVDMMALLESLQSDNEAMGRSVRIEGHVDKPYPGSGVAAAPLPGQSHRQRGALWRWRGHDPGGGQRAMPHAGGAGRRPGHRAAGTGEGVRAVLPTGGIPQPRDGRHRPGPGHCPQHRAHARRRYHPAQPAGARARSHPDLAKEKLMKSTIVRIALAVCVCAPLLAAAADSDATGGSRAAGRRRDAVRREGDDAHLHPDGGRRRAARRGEEQVRREAGEAGARAPAGHRIGVSPRRLLGSGAHPRRGHAGTGAAEGGEAGRDLPLRTGTFRAVRS